MIKKILISLLILISFNSCYYAPPQKFTKGLSHTSECAKSIFSRRLFGSFIDGDGFNSSRFIGNRKLARAALEAICKEINIDINYVNKARSDYVLKRGKKEAKVSIFSNEKENALTIVLKGNTNIIKDVHAKLKLFMIVEGQKFGLFYHLENSVVFNAKRELVLENLKAVLKDLGFPETAKISPDDKKTKDYFWASYSKGDLNISALFRIIPRGDKSELRIAMFSREIDSQGEKYFAPILSQESVVFLDIVFEKTISRLQ